jgi:hypothetical protein
MRGRGPGASRLLQGARRASQAHASALACGALPSSRRPPHSPAGLPPRPPSIDGIDVTLPELQQELATGKAYVHSTTDRYGRPVVVIRVKQHVIGARRRGEGGAGRRGSGAAPSG